MTSSNQPIALALRGVSKSFDRPAVDALDLTIYGGEFYALVGPNGAGKTTTLRMVVGLLKPDAGSIRIGGIEALSDPVAAKQITAWLSDEPMIYDKLTPYEYLEFVAGLWRIDPAVAQARARELIGWLGLEPHAHERCEGFSRGMRQKVALAGVRARCLGTMLPLPRFLVLQPPSLAWRLPYFRAVSVSTRSRRPEFRIPPCGSAGGYSRFAAVLQLARCVTRNGRFSNAILGWCRRR
jgi:ABC-type uncharacterized transport system ATPase subunit